MASRASGASDRVFEVYMDEPFFDGGSNDTIRTGDIAVFSR